MLESDLAGTVIGDLEGHDPNPGDTLSYSFVSGDGDTDNALFRIDGNSLILIEPLDYSVKAEYPIRVQVADPAGLALQKIFIIHLEENRPPHSLIFNGTNLIPESDPPGTIVGTVSATDPNSNDQLTYSVVSDSTNEDHTAFTIDNNSLVINQIFDFETKTNFSITIEAKDSGGLATQLTLSIQIENVIEDIPSLIDSGFYHNCAVLSNQTIQCWGWGRSGKLGNGSESSHSVPVPVSNISTATQVDAGSGHTCALLSNGTVQCWGYGFYGQLGNGSTSDQLTPVTVNNINTATQITVGEGFNCALLSDGSIQCWGRGHNGRLGNDSVSNQSSPVTVSGINTAIQVSVGSDHGCALLEGGAIQIAVGYAHNCALFNENSIQCWGLNTEGALGNGTEVNSTVPVKALGIFP